MDLGKQRADDNSNALTGRGSPSRWLLAERHSGERGLLEGITREKTDQIDKRKKLGMVATTSLRYVVQRKGLMPQEEVIVRWCC